MLSPSCARCGCALDARAVRQASASDGAGFALPARWMQASRVLGVLVGLLALYAATKAGYDTAGGSGALVAFGMGCFLLVPFVPQRLR